MNATQVFALRGGSTLALEGGAGTVVRLHDGKAWLTQYNDARDHMLRGGDTVALNGKGTALVYAFDATTVTLEQPANAKPVRRVDIRRSGEVHEAKEESAAILRPLCAAALLALVIALPAWAQHAGHHQAVRASELKWTPVPSLPKGAEITVIEGPMNQAVPFTVRIRFPANYELPPHTHPAVERVTVLSGTFHMGMGDKFNRAATTAVRAGDMMIMQPGTVHYAWTDTETVVQLHGTGPWGVNYVNPNDDPRKQ